MLRSVIMILVIAVWCDSKGYADNNDPHNTFRIEKFNKIWYKARMRLKGDKLDKFHDALLDLEKQTFHMKETGLQSVGKYKQTIEGRLADLMKDFALQDVFSALYGREHPVKSDLSKVFKSKKVQQLWEKAKLAGYTDEQLAYMREDFMQQDERSQKLKQAKEKYFGHETNEVINKRDSHSDVIVQDKSSEEREAINTNHLPRTSSQILSDLEDDLRKGYARLQDYGKPMSKEFVDSRVRDLWSSALDANLSHQDLATVQVDLMSLEKLKMRLRILQGQAKHGNEKMAGLKDNSSELHESIQKHLKKIEKLENFIKNKIESVLHSEL